MNGTLQVPLGYPPVELPSKSIVNMNLAMTVVFTVVSPIFNGILILVVLCSKQLRSQPHQLLLANYLLSSIALMFGIGIYRILQIENYRNDGFVKSSEQTNCGVARFLEFPLMTGNFCLLLLGFERYLSLKYNRTIDLFVLFLFLVLPWTLGIYRYSFELFSSKERYLNIPYVGLCIDISIENEERRNLYTVLNVIIPLFFGLITIILAYYKTFVAFKNVSVYLRRRSLSNINEETILLRRKKLVRKVFQSVNLAAILLGIRILKTAIISSLFSQFRNEGFSRNYRDRVGTIGMVIIYLETVMIPIIYLTFNRIMHQDLVNIAFKLIPWHGRQNISVDSLSQHYEL